LQGSDADLAAGAISCVERTVGRASWDNLGIDEDEKGQNGNQSHLNIMEKYQEHLI
jgi:hypothetical protein